MLSRVILILALVYVCSCTLPRSGKVIYGTDDRKDTFEVSSSLQSMGSSSVIILFGSDNILTQNNDGTWTATSTETAEDFWDYCPEERFSEQLILSEALGFCSGFLLSSNPPWIGTAAHCTEGSVAGAWVIFGFELTSAGNTRLTFDADQVYFVKSVVTAGTSSGGTNDYGIFELDRNVINQIPYSSFNTNLGKNDNLVMIGYPNGLPKKTDAGGSVIDASSSIIHATVDAYGGNSGSPVFDSNGNLAGILVGGSQDFDYSSCLSSNHCPGGPGCENGENIVPICALLDSTNEVINNLGGCSGVSSLSSGSSFSSFSTTTFSSVSSVSTFSSLFTTITSFTSDSSSSNDSSSSSNDSSSSSNDSSSASQLVVISCVLLSVLLTL